MSDAYVGELQYILVESETVSYRDPPPLEGEFDDWSYRLENGRLTFRLKQEIESVREARAVVDPFIRAWEVTTGLDTGSALRFKYQGARMVSRRPGVVVLAPASATIRIRPGSPTLHVTRSEYPVPPEHFRVNPDVDTLLYRFEMYRHRGEPLQSMAYFCLSSVLALGSVAAGRHRSARDAAARHFGVAASVLSKLGELTARGDLRSARKAVLDPHPLSGSEETWIVATVKALIQRLGDTRPVDQRPQITMEDLPRL